MPKLATPLTDDSIANLAPRPAGYKVGDGFGLYLFVDPSGNTHKTPWKRHHTTSRALLAPAREGKQIPKAIRARLNRLAHSRAQLHGQQVRDDALAELQRMVDGGAGIDALSAALVNIEGA